MRWLIAALALALSQQARAQELEFNVATNSTSMPCAWYRGSFNVDDYQGPQTEARPRASCKILGDSVSCRVSNHGLSPNTIVFTGHYKLGNNVIILETGHQTLNMRIICSSLQDGCYQLQMWNVQTFIGYACDIHTVAKPTQPKKQPEKRPVSEEKKGDLAI